MLSFYFVFFAVSNFNDSFEIKDEKSGNVTIIRPIDREKLSTAAIKLKILAHDITAINISSECDNKTNSISNKDEADVIVRIIDQDDNPPIFKQPEIKKGLRRTVELDTKLLDLEVEQILDGLRIHSLMTFYFLDEYQQWSSTLRNGENCIPPGMTL